METTIKLNAHELKEVIENGALLAFAETVNSKSKCPLEDATKEMGQVTSVARAQQVPVSVQQTEVPVITAPIQAVAQMQTPVPVVAPAATQSVLVAAPSYTVEQLAQAGMQLVDAGKRESVISLLQSFGVQALTELAPEYYGAYAAKLRELGANI